MAEIGEQTVGDVEHRVRDAGQARPERGARLGQLEAPDQHGPVGRSEVGVLAAQHLEPEKGVADRAADPDPVAGPRPAAADLGAVGDLADRGQRQRRRARRRDRIAAEQVDPEDALVLGEAGGEALDPVVAEGLRQRRGQQVMQRPRAHRREVGQVDPQQLAGDEVGRVVGQVMHALDHRVDGHHQPMPRRAVDQRRIVGQTQPARPGQRREEPPDPAELAETFAPIIGCSGNLRPSRRTGGVLLSDDEGDGGIKKARHPAEPAPRPPSPQAREA